MIAETRPTIPFPTVLLRSCDGRLVCPETLWERRFGARLESAHEVRRHVRPFAIEARADETAEYIFVQVVDELVSNSIKALRCEANGGSTTFPYGTHFGVRLGLAEGRLFAQVWDPCPVLPEIPALDALDEGWLLAEGGRGLALVRALSSFMAVIRHVQYGAVSKSIVVTVAPNTAPFE